MWKKKISHQTNICLIRLFFLQKILDTIAERVELKRNRIDEENSVLVNDNDEKRKMFAEKFGDIQAEISFSPEKVDIVR